MFIGPVGLHIFSGDRRREHRAHRISGTMHGFTHMSGIEYNDQQLSPVNYAELLQAIQEEMQKPTKESEQSKNNEYIFPETDRLSFDIDTIADAVARKFADSNRYPFEIRDGLSYASVYTLDIKEKSDFSHDLHKTFQSLPPIK